MKSFKICAFVAALLSIPIILLTSCDSRPTETVKGKISNVFLKTKDKGYAIRQGVEREDKIFILDFSAARFDQNMKNLPYTMKDGFYEIPKESAGTTALKMEDGELVYFQNDKEYEVAGALGKLEKINLFPAEHRANKQHFLLSVEKIRMSANN